MEDAAVDVRRDEERAAREAGDGAAVADEPQVRRADVVDGAPWYGALAMGNTSLSPFSRLPYGLCAENACPPASVRFAKPAEPALWDRQCQPPR